MGLLWCFSCKSVSAPPNSVITKNYEQGKEEIEGEEEETMREDERENIDLAPMASRRSTTKLHSCNS